MKILMATSLRISMVALVALMNSCLSLASFPCQSDADCLRAGADGQCVFGSCAFPDVSCPSGRRWDTTAQTKAGECVCSADFSSDPANCGSCGKICTTPSRATSACVGGVCTITSCAAGYHDCDGQYGSGCESVLSDSDGQLGAAIDHCGACGTACPLPARATMTACQASACRVTACAESYADCDGQFDNGCECNSGRCVGSTCAAPTCSDAMKNGTETDVDCGGASCSAKCALGKRCLTAGDCQSNHCNSSKVCAPFCDSCNKDETCCGTFCAAWYAKSSGGSCIGDWACLSCYCVMVNPMDILSWRCR